MSSSPSPSPSLPSSPSSSPSTPLKQKIINTTPIMDTDSTTIPTTTSDDTNWMQTLNNVIKLMSKTQYNASHSNEAIENIEDVCLKLFQRDHTNVILLDNKDSSLCVNYPKKIIIPVSDLIELNSETLKETVQFACTARCRTRFPVPVIMYNGKYICRSATVARYFESFARNVAQTVVNIPTRAKEVVTMFWAHAFSEPKNEENQFEMNLFEALDLNNLSIPDPEACIYKPDVDLLKLLNVSDIYDLMVEDNKIKYQLCVSSSEKAIESLRLYSSFKLVPVPYPGCEFFKDFRDNFYNAEGLRFDWNQSFVNANMDFEVVDENVCNALNVCYKNYRSWDVAQLTKNYLKLMLHALCNGDHSILVHCISGWDRTPLFISLLRLSLWADGKIHQNLSPLEMTCFTVAYDWFMFGHHLSNRLDKGEEIMFFSFQFLKYITDDELSIENIAKSSSNRQCNSNSNGSTPSKVYHTNGKRQHSHSNNDGDDRDDDDDDEYDAHKNGDGDTDTTSNGNGSHNSSFEVFNTSSEENLHKYSQRCHHHHHHHQYHHHNRHGSTDSVKDYIEIQPSSLPKSFGDSIKQAFADKSIVKTSSINDLTGGGGGGGGSGNCSWSIVSESASISSLCKAQQMSPSKQSPIREERKQIGTRQQKLLAVRTYFHRAYSTTLNERLKNGYQPPKWLSLPNNLVNTFYPIEEENTNMTTSQSSSSGDGPTKN